MKAKSKSTCVFIVANGLLRRMLVLFSLDLLLQNKNGLVLGLKIRAKLLEHRLIGGRESAEQCLRVEVIVGTILIMLVSDVRVPATTATAGRPSVRSIIRTIRRGILTQSETFASHGGVRVVPGDGECPRRLGFAGRELSIAVKNSSGIRLLEGDPLVERHGGMMNWAQAECLDQAKMFHCEE